MWLPGVLVPVSCVCLAGLVFLHAYPQHPSYWAGLVLPDVLFSVRTNEKVVALTIDDGPHPDVTPEILAVLKKWQVNATFFIIGQYANRWPKLLNDIADQGHEVGNHLMADKPAHAHSPEQFERELIQVDAILRPFWYHTVFCRRFNFLGARSTK